ncbi:hypothetical protein [Variovorax sp. GT1P44]|uniref:hypothetical protein n=1 Tax=Variovorax sp. GT1P44 TaxID=3443742 RepID=UPI003F485433
MNARPYAPGGTETVTPDEIRELQRAQERARWRRSVEVTAVVAWWRAARDAGLCRIGDDPDCEIGSLIAWWYAARAGEAVSDGEADSLVARWRAGETLRCGAAPGAEVMCLLARWRASEAQEPEEAA